MNQNHLSNRRFVSDGEIFSSKVLRMRALQVGSQFVEDFDLFDGRVILGIVLGVLKTLC